MGDKHSSLSPFTPTIITVGHESLCGTVYLFLIKRNMNERSVDNLFLADSQSDVAGVSWDFYKLKTDAEYFSMHFKNRNGPDKSVRKPIRGG